jgi:hypothetical protein
MPRDEVDDDPDHTCSHGLHVGALEYIPHFGLYQSDRRVVLVAVAAEDFVAVPKDYDGTKARVCKYEVLEEVDKKFIAEFVEGNQTVVRLTRDEETILERVIRVLEELSENRLDLDENTTMADLALEDGLGLIETSLLAEFGVECVGLSAHTRIADIVSFCELRMRRLAA